jgi:hypothetical protein
VKLSDKELGQAGHDFLVLSLALLDFALGLKNFSRTDGGTTMANQEALA